VAALGAACDVKGGENTTRHAGLALNASLAWRGSAINIAISASNRFAI